MYCKLDLEDNDAAILETFHEIFCVSPVWMAGAVTKKWKGAIIKMLHRNKDRSLCGHYRKMLLVANAGKTSLKSIARRLSNYYCERYGLLPEDQSMFNQDAPHRQNVCGPTAAELGHGPGTLLYVIFLVDLTKGWDSVDRPPCSLDAILQPFGTPSSMYVQFYAGMCKIVYQ